MALIDALLTPVSVRMQFQPIFEIAGRKLRAVEALARGPRGSHFQDPAVLFDYIRLKHAEPAADRFCVLSALAEAAELPASIALSINIHACTLELDADFADFVLDAAARHALAPSRLVLEIVEQGRYWNRHRLMFALDALREAGVRIALDDVGAGTCNFGTILDVRPDFLKIDAYIVQGCGEDRYRLRMLDAISRLAADFGANAIAEGVETQSDLDAVASAGIGMAQGYLFARPASLADLGLTSQRIHSNKGDSDAPQEDSARG